ncbi:putative RNA methyltransferase, partial [Microbispora sp. NPDC049633]|uniref:putative RNA methyltransferase n=1 Tax=Microbispora sp. NPDC049633 TaxID=3154355 RepID=UPI00341CB81B
MLADVIDHLVCPACGTAIHLADGSVRCARGHSFDVARQGYVNMLTRPAGTADTPAMVAARARFLEAGHYAPLAGLKEKRTPVGPGRPEAGRRATTPRWPA